MLSHLNAWWDEVREVANEIQPTTVGNDGKLAEGPALLHAWCNDSEGRPLCCAYRVTDARVRAGDTATTL